MAAGDYFFGYCSNLRIGPDKRQSISYRTDRIVKQLNYDLRGLDSSSSNRFYVGSYGRGTAIPSVSDVDVLYELPTPLYATYDAYASNGQSALLAAVRASIKKTYATSDVAGDGQVVVIEFNDGVKFEVLPAFTNQGGGYTFADSNNGGSWKSCKPKQEMNAFLTRNKAVNGNLSELSRMVRGWRDFNAVPMSGMLIDTLTYQFLETWEHRDKSYAYFGILTMDFFKFLANQNTEQIYWLAPGSGSYVYRKGPFEYKARQAELRALEALQFQNNGHEWSAKQKYREIYGPNFPS